MQSQKNISLRESSKLILRSIASLTSFGRVSLCLISIGTIFIGVQLSIGRDFKNVSRYPLIKNIMAKEIDTF
ncbi:CMF_collapsed_G0013310.mRNA.1.CDS.1 [Saccharomyces cerevisiae]|nr:CMF_collapsed_G0013310.mRNA.1.CDS.1 [Saccharomyces cerevisiae]